MKLILGTVQFGLEYGINNSIGKASREEIFKILNKAYELNIRDLDTSDLYGDALEVLEDYSSEFGDKFNIMSKFILENESETIIGHLNESLKRLSSTSIEGYSFHRFNDYKKLKNLNEISQELKSQGLIKKIGVSLYSNEELEIAINDPAVDTIQLPFNLFDSDPKKIALLEMAKKLKKEIHVRSIFLQGIFYMDINQLTGNLISFKPALESLHAIRNSEGLSVEDLCFGFVNSFDCIDGIVFGVDTIEQLDRNLMSAQKNVSEKIKEKILEINNYEKGLLNPSKWEK
ncbi:MAG: aldo/keto reductase [Bacteriovorax sp.]|nr:aldo/keto reductase [Bacteriovorax sp.]